MRQANSGERQTGGDRDLRLDAFRGLALWFIFVNHIPANLVSWLTPRNFGLSDSTEIFVFISGYTAAMVYGRTLERSGYPVAAAQVLHRCWTLYATYLVLFFGFAAQIAYTARVFGSPLFVEEMGLAAYFHDPVAALTEALALRFRPANLDILPLYIVLMASLVVLLPLLRRFPGVALAGSVALYVAARAMDWNLPTYPDGGVWYFNPFAWQLMFVFGAAMRRLPEVAETLARPRPLATFAAAFVLLASLALTLSWRIPALDAALPLAVAEAIYPISKTDMDPLRIVHFLALAYLALRFVPVGAPWLRHRLLAPVVACGRQSLPVFCLGVLLSFAGQTVLVHVSGSIPAQIAVTVVGIGAMTGLAMFVTWYRTAGKVRPPEVAAARNA